MLLALRRLGRRSPFLQSLPAGARGMSAGGKSSELAMIKEVRGSIPTSIPPSRRTARADRHAGGPSASGSDAWRTNNGKRYCCVLGH